MSRRILVHEPWSYVLFEEDGEYRVSFVVAGRHKRDYTIIMTESEKDMQRRDRSYVERLVKRLGDQPLLLQSRCLPAAVWPEGTS